MVLVDGSPRHGWTTLQWGVEVLAGIDHFSSLKGVPE
jgi:hypothetical protein